MELEKSKEATHLTYSFATHIHSLHIYTYIQGPPDSGRKGGGVIGGMSPNPTTYLTWVKYTRFN